MPVKESLTWSRGRHGSAGCAVSDTPTRATLPQLYLSMFDIEEILDWRLEPKGRHYQTTRFSECYHAIRPSTFKFECLLLWCLTCSSTFMLNCALHLTCSSTFMFNCALHLTCSYTFMFDCALHLTCSSTFMFDCALHLTCSSTFMFDCALHLTCSSTFLFKCVLHLTCLSTFMFDCALHLT